MSWREIGKTFESFEKAQEFANRIIADGGEDVEIVGLRDAFNQTWYEVRWWIEVVGHEVLR